MIPDPMAAIVTLDQISKTFGNGTVALSGLSLQVREGEFISLLGPSGCGKSTALRIIAGLTDASQGRLTWAGGQGRERGLGFVFQEPTLMPWATAFDNVWLPLKLKGESRAAARDTIEHALDMVGLKDFGRSYPRELSGGMKMRVSIARALVTRPRLLLMDEPFAALDEITRHKLNNDLLKLQAAERFTVVFVTHSVFESVYLSSRIVVMAARPGRVLQEFTVDEPQPRTEEFRTSAAYVEHCRVASQALHSALDATDHL
jgi:NitT/TauT family transport system ATP-binding protein